MRKELWASVMRAALRVFGPDNPYGVYAFGIGPRVSGGQRKERSLVVYVERKLIAPEHPIPALVLRYRGRRSTIVPDVVATGGRARAAQAHGTTYSGLHAGAAIASPLGTGRMVIGGVACLLGDGQGPRYLLTAGHLFARGAGPVPVRAAASGTAPSQIVGHLAVNFLDAQPPPGRHTLDVAAVKLEAAGAALARASTRGPKPVDVMPSDRTDGVGARAFLPTAHDYSAEVSVVRGPYHAFLAADARPGNYEVWDVLRTDRAITAPGDSGTILATADAPTLVIGSCVGEDRQVSLFEPLGVAIARLRRMTNETLSIWRRPS
jgi:hypothetical protein